MKYTCSCPEVPSTCFYTVYFVSTVQSPVQMYLHIFFISHYPILIRETHDNKKHRSTTSPNTPHFAGVKSSIGKLPTYTVTEQVSFSDHPYELPPGDEEDSQVIIFINYLGYSNYLLISWSCWRCPKRAPLDHF